MIGTQLAEAGLLPDSIVRAGIRSLVRGRLAEFDSQNAEEALAQAQGLRAELSAGPIALAVNSANEQHYEVAAAYFERVLGARLKYSSGLFEEGVTDLDAAEERMLGLTCRRAGIEDGMRILDLGCGWGSLSLWIAEHYPSCEVLGVSNSKSQRESILGRCHARGFDKVRVETCDINHFDPGRRFDRVVSVEMFEHVRNHALLLSRIARWLEPDGKLFVHHFAHREYGYPYTTEGDDDWMGRYFFSGGIMPSDDLLLHRQRDLVVERSWRVNGTHYQKTSEAWLVEQDRQREALLPILAGVYGAADAELWFQRWRLFFLACAELFGTRDGNEWWVTHVLMGAREARS